MILAIDASRAVTTQRTGTEAYAYHLIRALLPLANANKHTVILYFNQSPNSPISPSPHHARMIPFPRLWTHIRLAAELHLHPPDVFFTPAHVIPFSYRGAAVATIHDLGYHYFPEAHTARQVRQLTWSTRHNARRSRQVIVDSLATQRDLAQFYGISAEKIITIYPGFDKQLAPVHDQTMLERVQAKYQLTAPYFLFLSTLQPRKNVSRIVTAFAQIADQLPQQLVLAGKQGWLAQPLLAQIAALPESVRRRIRLTGFIDDVDKAALLSGATALVYPSQHEGFGFPVLEAQACGTPVLTARNSSLIEVGGQAVCFVEAGSVVQIATAMLKLAQHSAYREQLITAGFANIKRFDWQVAAQQTLAVLEQVAA
ncbi:MAG TPA: glycosyltransferase family 1 protein [Anaerolineae bacterium]|nr:glycosyltransferase family 1 protein [Anaerolineae bacterium]